MSETPWHVAHTRPRCEKKFLAACHRAGLEARLPCYRSARSYRGKNLVFHKPLFPGYVFLRLPDQQAGIFRTNKHLVRLLPVPEQEEFSRQLADIERALLTAYEVRLEPAISEGMRVKVKHGPLRGVDGWVEKRHGMSTILIRLDFIGQAAAVQLHAGDLELI